MVAQIKRKIQNILLVILLCLQFVFLPISLSIARAEERVYTNVLADLQKDESFNVIDYPEVNDTENKLYGTIQVIQIAESESGELYLYAYQPSNKVKELTATEINMSLSETVNGTSLFPLTLLNTNGVFCKYLVNGVIVSSDAIRYYNISSIYRDWDENIDNGTGNDNIKNAVSFGVGKVFKAETVDSETKYSCKNVDVITILNPYCGFIAYDDGLHWDFLLGIYHLTDVHFIAFDTDFPIDTLQEADVSYVTQPYTYKTGEGYTYGETSPKQYLTLTGETTGSNAGDGFLGIKYTWKAIQKSEDFKKSVTLTSDAESQVNKTKWVLLFLTSPRTESEIETFGGTIRMKSGTMVSQVSILRLQFITAGKSYNLGTVSDKVTEGENPSGRAPEMGWFEKLCLWLEQVTGVPSWVWKIIIIALPFLIILPILAVIFPIVAKILLLMLKGIAKLFIWLFKGIWWLISAPFNGIAALVRKIKDKGDSP